MPLVLAGGLRLENVAEAVRTVRPFAVGVSGCVERADEQRKDVEKMRAFVQAAKGVVL
jgi:phosphoribosylanthranilate isomerase